MNSLRSVPQRRTLQPLTSTRCPELIHLLSPSYRLWQQRFLDAPYRHESNGRALRLLAFNNRWPTDCCGSNSDGCHGSSAMMHVASRMALFSEAYATAIAAVCGYEIRSTRLDDDSIDVDLRSKQPGRPRLEIQLKATSTVLDTRSTTQSFPFRLSAKNYNDLRLPIDAIIVPRMLVVVLMPDELGQWLEHGDRHLLLRHDSYFLNLRNQPAITTKTCTVQMPWGNHLTVESLRNLMDHVAAHKDLP